MISSCPLHTSLLDLAERLLGLFFARLAGVGCANLGRQSRRNPEQVNFSARPRNSWPEMLHLQKRRSVDSRYGWKDVCQLPQWDALRHNNRLRPRIN